MKVLLRPNLKKKNSASCLDRTIDTLVALGAVPMLDNAFQPHVRHRDGCVFGAFEELLRRCDLLMSIGGDGTLLHTVNYAVGADKPLIGLNTGRVGFLTQMEDCEPDSLALLVQGRYTIQNRMLLEVQVEDAGEAKTFRALNEVVISRGSHRLGEIGVYCDEKLVVRHRADGLIFATPTGSTGYSLSAGGAVADPSLSVVLMTAICPFSTYNRSLILPPERVYCVRLEEEEAGSMDILADGDEVARVGADQTVRVKRSETQVRLIDLDRRDFYSNLRDKLLLRR